MRIDGTPLSASPVDAEQSAAAFVDQPVWVLASWCLLASLLVWSYGVNNIAIPRIEAPLVDLMFIALLVRSRRFWLPFRDETPGRQVFACLVWLTIFVFVRAVFDYKTYGLQAIRDSLFAVEAWAIFLGWGLARRVGRVGVERALTVTFTICLGWFCLYPFRDSIVSRSPIV